MLRSTIRWLAGLALTASMALAQAADTVTYYHNDLLGSPVAATNEAGQVIWRESYRPYGERLTNDAKAQGNDVWYTSRPQDADTGLVYLGARYYDPVIGRFLSTDPVGFGGKNIHSFNRYAYANNNPYKYVDPDGRQAVLPISPPGGGAIGISTGVLGKPSEAQQIRQLEGFGSSSGLGSFSIPSSVMGDAISFVLGGFPALFQDRAAGLILSVGEREKSLGANPFGGKSAHEIAEMLRGRGFEEKGPNAEGGRGSFVNPETGRGYHIDGDHAEPKGPHVGVHRPRDLRDSMAPRDYPMGDRQ